MLKLAYLMLWPAKVELISNVLCSHIDSDFCGNVVYNMHTLNAELMRCRANVGALSSVPEVKIWICHSWQTNLAHPDANNTQTLSQHPHGPLHPCPNNHRHNNCSGNNETHNNSGAIIMVRWEKRQRWRRTSVALVTSALNLSLEVQTGFTSEGFESWYKECPQ